MRTRMYWNAVLLLGLISCVCLSSTGCKSMKSPFPKMAFWKHDGPPKSELAARSREITPPSQNANMVEGTTSSNSAYAQNDSRANSQSAYNRTQPYSYERPDSNPLDAVKPASAYSASNDTSGNTNLRSNGFGQSPGGTSSTYQSFAADPGTTSLNAQNNNGFAASAAASELPDRYSTQPASEIPTYPSTSFAAFSPKASNAVHESNFDDAPQNQISQVSSNAPLDTPTTRRLATPPSLPVSALNRQGSYAPGSTGSFASPVNAGGFNPNFGTPAASKSACPIGCSCDKCKTLSAGGDFLPQGSRYGN